MTSSHSDQQVARRQEARETADAYAERARELVNKHLGSIFKAGNALEDIRGWAAEAMPHPLFAGNGRLVSETTKKDSDFKLSGLESSLETRGVYEDTARDLMIDLRALSTEILAARGKGIS